MFWSSYIHNLFLSSLARINQTFSKWPRILSSQSCGWSFCASLHGPLLFSLSASGCYFRYVPPQKFVNDWLPSFAYIDSQFSLFSLLLRYSPLKLVSHSSNPSKVSLRSSSHGPVILETLLSTARRPSLLLSKRWMPSDGKELSVDEQLEIYVHDREKGHKRLYSLCSRIPLVWIALN